MAPHRKIILFTRSSTRKFDFRVIINLFNLVLFALLGAGGAISIGYEDSYSWDLISLTSPAISIIWTTTVIVLLLTTSLEQRYHPAIDLTFDIISWLAFWILGGFIITQVAAPEGLIMCSPYYGGVYSNSFCRNGLGTTKWNLNAAASAFMILNGLIHLVFFAIACHEVKLWRRQQWGQKRNSFELERK